MAAAQAAYSAGGNGGIWRGAAQRPVISSEKPRK